MKFHESEAVKGASKNRRKAAAIKKRLNELGFVPKQILAANLSSEEAFAVEKSLISQYGRIDLGTGRLTNLSDGGEGIGSRVSEETRQRMRDRALANGSRPPSRLGAKDSEETRRKKREKSIKNGNRPPLRKGPFSAEHRANLSKAMKGKPGRKGIPWSESRRAAFELNRSSRPTSPPLELAQRRVIRGTNLGDVKCQRPKRKRL
jgi:hypothetical protein